MPLTKKQINFILTLLVLTTTIQTYLLNNYRIKVNMLETFTVDLINIIDSVGEDCRQKDMCLKNYKKAKL